jgi:hypothetical protein
MGSCSRGDRSKKEQYSDHSDPCKAVVTSLSWLMGSILIVINNTNYYRKIESLLANQFVGG